MTNRKWQRELMYVIRNERGVIIEIREKKPADFIEPAEEEEKINDKTRFRVVGD
jgi:hypothetical protein